VYGSRQSLSNPYTGACAIFSSRILNDSPPYIFEDGKQLRDFINVKDIARANKLALESGSANGIPINVGTGIPISILDVADALTELYGKSEKLRPVVSGSYRKGDIRHCYADVIKAKELLGFSAEVSLREGLPELVSWGRSHGWGALDLFERSLQELKQKQLST
jgi:dTDP-L-rhamnose 4-epimerase